MVKIRLPADPLVRYVRLVAVCRLRSSHNAAITGRGLPPLIKLFVAPVPVITAPGDNHPLVLADSVVHRFPRYQKSKPMGMLLK